MKDSSMLKKEAEELKASIVKADAGPQKEQDALEKMQEKLRVLEVQSEINIPEVRWNVANGMGECQHQQSFRHELKDLNSRHVTAGS